MKLAIVHDELVRKGGAEQVALSLHRAYPESTIYTLSYNAETTYPEFKKCKIKISWFGRLIKDESNLKRFFFPFGILAMQRMNLKGYDIVLQSSTHCAKYITVSAEAVVITYCHTPFRLVWRAETYEEVVRSGYIKRKLYEVVISVLRDIDKKAAARTDWFVTNSREVVPRIAQAYKPKNKITVINPPVKCRNFYVSDIREDYFLVVSRFEPYKKVDLIIEAFNAMPHRKLIIVGKGSLEADLKKQAGENIVFMSSLSAQKLADLYARCQAFIFPQLEDYGITPLEANAAGRPVIAFGKGGILDTMIPVRNTKDALKATAVFFSEQTTEALKKAIATFEETSFDPQFIREHAEKFDESAFVDRIRNFVVSRFNNLHVKGIDAEVKTVSGQLK